MAKKKNPIEELEPVKYTTGKVWLVYPHFKTPHAFKEGDIPKYQVLLMTPKLLEGVGLERPKENPEVTNLKAILKKLWIEAGFSASDHNPLVDGDIKAKALEDDSKFGDTYKNNYYIKASSQFPIKVIDAKKLNWMGEDIDINGYIGRATIVLKAYKTSLGSGITAYLKGVQVISKGITIGSGDSVINDFDYEEVDEKEEDLPF